MGFLTIVIALAAALFALAFLTGRRFGILGLALLAGSYLANEWAAALTPAVERAGVTIAAPPLEVVVAIGLTLLPCLLLFISSPIYHGKRARALGALLFSLFTIVLLIRPLDDAFVIDGPGLILFDFITANYAVLVTVGLVLAIADLFLARPHKKHRKSEGSKH